MPGMDGFEVARQIRSAPGLGGTAIMMLSSLDPQTNAARCREVGITDYLVKPIRGADLLGAITRTLAAREAPAHGRSAKPARRTRREARTGAGVLAVAAVPEGGALNCLVAEDNAVNQLVIRRLLEKRGHRVTVVDNGGDAVLEARKTVYDVILMDVQMPDMDGIEATAFIRNHEREFGRHTTIVALTAHAMVGDRERCLTAGMDDYISKPVRTDDLDRILEALGQPAM